MNKKTPERCDFCLRRPGKRVIVHFDDSAPVPFNVCKDCRAKFIKYLEDTRDIYHVRAIN